MACSSCTCKINDPGSQQLVAGTSNYRFHDEITLVSLIKKAFWESGGNYHDPIPIRTIQK